MRIIYQDGKLLVSLTRDEVTKVNNEIGNPVELDIGNLPMLHEDITKAATYYLKHMQVKKELSESKQDE
jgi:hypothetical protein